MCRQRVKVKCTPVKALRLRTGRTAHRGNKGIALLFLDHGTRRGWGFSAMPRQHFTPGKSQYPLYRRLGWPQGRSGQVRKISPPPRFDPRTVQPMASRYTNWATRPTCADKKPNVSIKISSFSPKGRKQRDISFEVARFGQLNLLLALVLRQNDYEALIEWYWQGKVEVLRTNLVASANYSATNLA